VSAAGARERRRLHVAGTVQGVGFRPFVHALAKRLDLDGWVGNDPAGVVIEVEGPPAALTAFAEGILAEAPPLAEVAGVTVQAIPVVGIAGFAILASDDAGARRPILPPDTAPCSDCLAEITDPAERRHRYPFTNCTACGPRYSIVLGLPYDRPRTTMAPFPLCERCAAEYRDPTDRRFHAQPVCCPACGPRLTLLRPDGTLLAATDALAAAVALLAEGAVLAVKGIGGYHLACDATSEEAVALLRRRKQREERPLAVLVADVAAARSLCAVDAIEARILAGPRRPIVLLDRRPGAPVAEGVAPGNRSLGLLLPPSPLHVLLAEDAAGPLVLTSGNVTSEPIVHRDAEALERLGGIADGLLVHDREIAVRVDDSVVRVWRGSELPLRRARGAVPSPLPLPVAAPAPILAVGAELKSTVCVAVEGQAVVSQHLGDLEHYAAFRGFLDAVAHLESLLEVRPGIVAHDLHPDYRSTRWALEREAEEHVGVQHHHAHIASCLADHGRAEPVIGLALDGTGYGTDGTVWGGELLVADLLGFERVGHLATVRMPGGEAAIREPWRMAVAWLDAAFDGAPPDHPVLARHAERAPAVRTMARDGFNAPVTSSAGRLFDAVAALLGVRDAVTYEGQAATELEQAADPGPGDGYEVEVGDDLVLPAGALVRAVVADQADGVPVPVVAARFHRGLAATLVEMTTAVRERTGLGVVALSGGVFQNLLLLDLVTDGLETRGFEVLVHRRVPCNDGGISLGQAAVAAAGGGLAQGWAAVL
jgi:hydrogenase maturation protein HypF